MPLGVSWKFARISSTRCSSIELAGAEGVHHDRNRLRHADRVGQLHFAALRQAGGHDVLGHVARHVAGRAVHLRRILAGERAAAVPAHAAVGVHDDLAAGEAGVAVRSADDEAAGGIDVILGSGIHHVRGDHRIDDVLLHVRAELFGRDVVVVLRRDHHGVDALGLAVHVLHADLALAVGPQIAELAEAADLAQLPAPACAPA